jgi:hypothetical protein
MSFIFNLGCGIGAYWICEETGVYVMAWENTEGCIAVQFVP